MALGSTQPLTEIITRSISWGAIGGRSEGLTTLPPSSADCLEIWEPHPPGTLSACPDMYRDSLTLLSTLVILPYYHDDCIFERAAW
jgi:hypothetical protein